MPALNPLSIAKNCSIEFAGERFSLLDRAAYWESENALVVSDLHLGKAETFQNAGLPVPSGHAEADLARLESLLSETGAERFYLLGDLVHTKRGLTDEVVQTFTDWLAALPVEAQLVTGNHDRRAGTLPAAWKLEVSAGLERRGVLLTHAPLEAGPPHLCGHLHPVVKLRSGLDNLRLPCFVLDADRLVLPAFGSFTGGFEVKPGPGRRLFAVAGGEVVEL